jgi:hypothetical protein
MNDTLPNIVQPERTPWAVAVENRRFGGTEPQVEAVIIIGGL